MMTQITIRRAARFGGAALAVLMTLPSGLAAAQTGSVPPIPPVPKFDTSNPVKHGQQIAEYMDLRDSGWIDQYSKSRMTLFDSKGDKVERDVSQMTLEGKDGNKTMSRFLSPADVRGVAALSHEHPKGTDDSWLYLPASRRVRRISGANRTASFQGTEFTYEDLSTIEPSRYAWRVLAEEKVTSDGKSIPVWKVEAKPTYSDTGYSKLIFYINKAEFHAQAIEFFDKAGRKLKVLTFSKWKLQHGRFWRPVMLDMNNVQTRKRTVLNTKALFLNLAMYKKKDGSPRANLTADKFTRRALESQ